MSASEFKEIRQELGLNQWEMARALGVNQSSVSRMEADKDPTPIDLRTAMSMEFLRLARRSKELASRHAELLARSGSPA